MKFRWKYKENDENTINAINPLCLPRHIVRSLSGKNWQDLYKADKVSISFPATPKSN